ncbi:hypothetical protein [Streptomyces sp. NPDC085540]|uniref:hypothetical protein n=1 Tax=Streptomyces sp. NPDC085540 TaxID=3365730 RepID=UPI0037D25E1C
MTAHRAHQPDHRAAFARRLLLAVDAKGYGAADAVTQRQLQEGITRLVAEAADTARLERARWATQEGGDSLFAVLPEHTFEPALVDTFMRALNAGLRAFNRDRVRERRLRLRAAVHFGPASAAANGFTGRAPVETGRILDCAALRTALVRAPDADLAVAVSADVFRDVVQDAHTTIAPETLRRVRVEEKEFRGEAWIWLPDADARQLDLEPDRLRERAETADPGEGTAAVRGDISVDEVAGEAVSVRTDRAVGSLEGTARVGRVAPGGTVIGVDIRTAGGEK